MNHYLPWLIPLAVLALGILGLFGLRVGFRRSAIAHVGRRWLEQLILLALTVVVVVVVILSLPIGDSTREQLLSLLGVVLTGTIALSSTTFLGNALAGLMLRAVDNFRPGDFLRVGNHFGRVSEQGLLHTEVQTEDGDLTTLPNTYVITNPVTVVHERGTVISTTLSLGYDIHHSVIEEHLLAAASASQLTQPFVQVLELGDFSVTYRVAGFLDDVTKMFSRRSRLRRAVLDELHRAGIEIVSPRFINQRVFPDGSVFVPKSTPVKPAAEAEGVAEAVMFDKAEAAAEGQEAAKRLTELEAASAELKTQIRNADTESRPTLELELEKLSAQIERLRADVVASGDGNAPTPDKP